MPNLPPPPPPPPQKADSRPATHPFDIVVACIAVATLVGIVVFLFPHNRETFHIDSVDDSTIRLDGQAPAQAPSANAQTRNPEPETRNPEPVAAVPVAELHEGDILDVQIESISQYGDGMARHGNDPVYVKDAAVGETVRVRILTSKVSRVGNRYYNAERIPPEGTASDSAKSQPEPETRIPEKAPAAPVAELHEGDILEVRIESISDRGDGIARHGEAPIYVSNVTEGENVRVRILTSKVSRAGNRYYNAERIPPEGTASDSAKSQPEPESRIPEKAPAAPGAELHEGDILEVRIESISQRGDGVARHGEAPIYVSDVTEGETVRIRILSSKISRRGNLYYNAERVPTEETP